MTNSNENLDMNMMIGPTNQNSPHMVSLSLLNYICNCSFVPKENGSRTEPQMNLLHRQSLHA